MPLARPRSGVDPWRASPDRGAHGVTIIWQLIGPSGCIESGYLPLQVIPQGIIIPLQTLFVVVHSINEFKLDQHDAAAIGAVGCAAAAIGLIVLAG
ncbi:unnamed protein product [uncultured bacterium]|nr:unnamed protein product [uncultured bacterium]